MVEMDENILINSSFLPTKELIEKVKTLSENQAIFKDEEIIAFFTLRNQEKVDFESYEHIEFTEEILQIKNTWDIFSLNDKAIQADFDLLTEGKKSQPIPESVQCLNKENIFIEEGAKIMLSSLNATTGPIYIGKDAETVSYTHLTLPTILLV